MIVPKHVAIIPDGNRRYVANNVTLYAQAYNLGAKNLIDNITLLLSEGVECVSFYAFSKKNFERSKIEKKIINDMMRSYLPKMEELVKENDLRVVFAGDIELFPKDLYEEFSRIESFYCEGTKTIIPLIAYSGSDDTLQAAKSWVGSGMKGHPDDYRYAKNVPDVDLLIRTGIDTTYQSKELPRTSDFLPKEISEALLYFSNKFWPEFSKEDTLEALKTYSKANRRLGK